MPFKPKIIREAELGGNYKKQVTAPSTSMVIGLLIFR